MKITNPTENRVSIQISGRKYSVDAGESISGVREDHAQAWQNIHGFLQVSEEASEVKEKPEKVKAPEKEADAVEAPKPKAKAKQESSK